MSVRELTPQQQALWDAADRLTATIARTVPGSTMHWAVEDARRAAATLARMVATVHTADKA